MEFTLEPLRGLTRWQPADRKSGELATIGKGLADLPDRRSPKYLRPFGLQAEVGYAG
jgi:hypothetical protein